MAEKYEFWIAVKAGSSKFSNDNLSLSQQLNILVLFSAGAIELHKIKYLLFYEQEGNFRRKLLLLFVDGFSEIMWM